MTKYIAILRGINVSGQKKILMAELREYMGDIGFEDVDTYIQSGNIVFNSSLEKEGEIEDKIGSMIQSKYGFDVPTLVKTLEGMQYVLDHCPFPKDPSKEIKKVYVTFLSEKPDPELVSMLEDKDFSPEEIIVDGVYLFGYSPLGLGNAKFNNNFIEAKLKVSATTRNWNTVNKLAEMAKTS